MNEDEILSMLRAALADVAPDRQEDHATIGLDHTLTDLDIDSLSVMEMVGQVEDRLDLTLDDRALASVRTIGELVALIRTTFDARVEHP